MVNPDGDPGGGPGDASQELAGIPTAFIPTGDLVGNPPTAVTLASALQELFCLEYMKDMNGARAAVRAGFSPRSAKAQACNLLAKPAVSARIAQLMAERALRLRFDGDRVVLRLCAVVERCMQTAPILDHRGAPVLVELANRTWVPGYEFNAMGAIRGLALLGRHFGIFGAPQQPRETELSVEALRRLADERETPEEKAARMEALAATLNLVDFDELMEEYKPPEVAKGNVEVSAEADGGRPALEDFEAEEE